MVRIAHAPPTGAARFVAAPEGHPQSRSITRAVERRDVADRERRDRYHDPSLRRAIYG
jgi:hypothetical protein